MGADKSKQFVLKVAAKYGFMGRYNNKLDFSPFERFQVGDAGLANGSYDSWDMISLLIVVILCMKILIQR